MKQKKSAKKMSKKKSSFDLKMFKFLLFAIAILQAETLIKYVVDFKMQNAILMEKLMNRPQMIVIQQTEIGQKPIEIEKVYKDITAQERQELAEILYCEARGESVECQRAVISVILNRVASKQFPNTIHEVIYQSCQFEPVFTGAIKNAKPSQTQYDAVDYVIENGTTIPDWVCYFRASYHFDWENYTEYTSISHTYFGGFKN